MSRTRPRRTLGDGERVREGGPMTSPKLDLSAIEVQVNRDQFIAWTDGILLSASRGWMLLVDERAYGLAQSELDAGRTVVLTLHGRPVTRLRKAGDEYREEDLP